MKNEEISNNTRKRMASALKALLSEKSIEKITVRDITTRAGLSRPTFYYHFKDINGLVEWMFRTELMDLLQDHLGDENLSGALLITLRYMKNNTALCQSICEGVGYGKLYQLFIDCIKNIIMQFTAHLNEQYHAKQEDVDFIGAFYTNALAGSLIIYMQSGMTRSPEEMLDRIMTTSEGSIANSLRRSVERHGTEEKK